MRVSRGESAVGRQHAHFFVIDHLENGLEEIQPIAGAGFFQLALDIANFLRQWTMCADYHIQSLILVSVYLPVPKNSLIES